MGTMLMLYAGGNHHIGFTDADAVRRHGHGRQTGGAETVDGDAADAGGQSRQHGTDTRHVQALLGFGNRAAADDVLDRLGVQARHLGQRRLERGGQQIVGTVVAEKPLCERPMGVRVAATI
jgi:hypothetical protein